MRSPWGSALQYEMIGVSWSIIESRSTLARDMLSGFASAGRFVLFIDGEFV